MGIHRLLLEDAERLGLKDMKAQLVKELPEVMALNSRFERLCIALGLRGRKPPGGAA